MKLLFLWLFMGVLGLAVGDPNVDETDLVEAHLNFARKLRNVVQKGKEASFLYSPLLVSLPLTLLYLVSEGRTKKEIKDAMQLKFSDYYIATATENIILKLNMIPSSSLRLKNHIYAFKDIRPLKERFKSYLKFYFKTDATLFENLNRSTEGGIRRTMNWNNNLATKARRNYQPIGMPISSDAFTIVSSLSFDGLWQSPFKQSLTRHETVFNGNRNVKFSQLKVVDGDLKLYYDLNMSATYLQIPYTDNRLSLNVLIPTNEMSELENKLKSVDLRNIERKAVAQKVNFEMPKFSRKEETLPLTDILRKLKINTLFSSSADLGGISEFERKGAVEVKKMRQKTLMSVDENGSKLSTTQETGTNPTFDSPGKLRVKNRYPFLFYIREKSTGLILYEGRFTPE